MARHLRFIMTYAPNYIYLVPGNLLFILCVLLQVLLVSGPLKIGRFFMGSHFLAFGLLLTLAGINIVTQGLVAKVILLKRTQLMDNKLVGLVRSKFTLERGLILGISILMLGLLIDCQLLFTWLRSFPAMEESIHLAFVGSDLIVLGINIIFSSFLLGMLLF